MCTKKRVKERGEKKEEDADALSYACRRTELRHNNTDRYFNENKVKLFTTQPMLPSVHLMTGCPNAGAGVKRSEEEKEKKPFEQPNTTEFQPPSLNSHNQLIGVVLVMPIFI